MQFNNDIKNLFFEFLQLKNKLNETEKNFKWSGNHIGDYGEYIAVTRYGLDKAKEGTKGYDAINKSNGDRVQIKTVRKGTPGIHFNKYTDALLVLEINDDASWDVIYDGKLDKILERFKPREDYYINLSTLKKINSGTYNRVLSYEVTLKGKVVSAKNRRELRKKLLKLNIRCVSEDAINKRFGRDKEIWQNDLERIFGIKVPPKYAKYEEYVEEKGYSFFPEIPNKEIDGNPLISEFNKKIYISQTEFAKEFDIPDDFVSDKLPKYNTLEIIGLYKNVRDKKLKK